MAGWAGPGADGSSRFVAAVAESLRHRGPESSNHASFEDCVLVHTRLRIIDLSPAGDEPLPNEDRTVWLSFNGEIYNWKRLRQELVSRGHRMRSECDAEVLVHLYEDEGVRFLRRIRGIFAFALWDSRRRRLVLARDRLGVKPLYYRQRGASLVFASEVRAVVAAANGASALDPDAIRDVLVTGAVRGPRTIVEGVRELPPAHVGVWENGAFTTEAYWSPPAPSGPVSREDAVAELRDRLDEAVASQLEADVPLGVFLSSGLDSTLVAAIASRHRPGLESFTVGFAGDATDERDAARETARMLRLRHREVELRHEDALAAVPPAVAAMDQPSVDGLNTWIVAGMARRAGLVVCLSGLGGDELFGGYPSFRRVPTMLRVARALRWLPPGAAGTLGRWAAYREDASLPRLMRFLASDRSAWTAYRAVREVVPAHLVRGGAEGAGSPHIREPNVSRAVSMFELTDYMTNQLLRDTDQMSMSHSMEVRVPLLDDELVDHVLRIPEDVRLGGPPKSLLRDSIRPLVPRHVAARRKRTFTLPMERWLRTSLRDTARSCLLEKHDALDEVLPRDARARLWREFQRGRLHWSRVWAPIVVAWWDRARTDDRTERLSA